MSWVRIWVHLVFSTKNRKPFLHKDVREQLLLHIKENALRKDIWLDCFNGYSDHIHCLISLDREQTISTVAQLIKGESSFWLNKNYFLKSKFRWQDDFWAVSVSESHVKRVR
jgi:putative transposase